jgi:4-hydroxybenzoate polyprenyltransferase
VRDYKFIFLTAQEIYNDSLVGVTDKKTFLQTMSDSAKFFRLLVKALRIPQWVKNLLLFVPLIVGHKFTHPDLLVRGFIAFIAFSLCASSVYITNDILDIEADREHPRKKNRPFASGALKIKTGVIIAILLFAIGFGISFLLPFYFSAALLLYMIASTAYSLKLKKIASVDVIMLASLYTLRVLAGGIAVDVLPTTWLLGFSIFIFLSLAFVKRYSELRMLRESGNEIASRRGYTVGDLELLRSIGPASGYLSVLVLALYINSPEVRLLYKRPSVLWLVCLLLLLWITRLWILTNRGKVSDDPLVFTVRDSRSYMIGAVMIFVILAATL